MKIFSGIRGQILGAFILLTLGIGLFMGLAGYVVNDETASCLISAQARPVMETLIEAERQAIRLRDRKDEDLLESGKLAEALGWTFLVGKEIPAKWKNLSPGLSFLPDDSGFVLMERRDNTLYALSGSLDQFYRLRSRLLGILVFCGFFCLLGAVLMALFLSTRLCQPLCQLRELVLSRDDKIMNPGPSSRQYPPALLNQPNEVGLLARTLAKSERQLQEYFWRETCFTGDASHELRTPLTVLQGGLEVLEGHLKNLPEPSRKAAAPVMERLLRASVLMNDIVHTLLLLARAPHSITTMRLDLTELVTGLLISMSRGANFHLDLETSSRHESVNADGKRHLEARVATGVHIVGHAALASVVIKNLLENALRYSDNGKARFYLTAEGIMTKNPGRMPANLDIFARGARGKNQTENGCGFGLSLALRACEHLGWSLVCEQGEEETIFRVRFK